MKSTSTKPTKEEPKSKKYTKLFRVLRYIILFFAVVEILGRVIKIITGVLVLESIFYLTFWLFVVAILAVFEFKSNKTSDSVKK